MTEEELALCPERLPNVLLAVDVALAPVHDADVPCETADSYEPVSTEKQHHPATGDEPLTDPSPHHRSTLTTAASGQDHVTILVCQPMS